MLVEWVVSEVPSGSLASSLTVTEHRNASFSYSYSYSRTRSRYPFRYTKDYADKWKGLRGQSIHHRLLEFVLFIRFIILKSFTFSSMTESVFPLTSHQYLLNEPLIGYSRDDSLRFPFQQSAYAERKKSYAFKARNLPYSSRSGQRFREVHRFSVESENRRHCLWESSRRSFARETPRKVITVLLTTCFSNQIKKGKQKK